MENLLNEALGFPGRMISASKSGYRDRYPNNLAIFNANVCTDAGKLWWGDVDLTLSKDALSQAAIAGGQTIYVLYEMDGRFENEDSPKIKEAVVRFLPDGTVKIREDLQQYYKL
jgi:hypothetical protein